VFSTAFCASSAIVFVATDARVVQFDPSGRLGIDPKKSARTQTLSLIDRQRLLRCHDEVDDGVPGEPADLSRRAVDGSSPWRPSRADAEQMAFLEAAAELPGCLGQDDQIRRIGDPTTST
jgi:hypothetical protein